MNEIREILGVVIYVVLAVILVVWQVKNLDSCAPKRELDIDEKYNRLF